MKFLLVSALLVLAACAPNGAFQALDGGVIESNDIGTDRLEFQKTDQTIDSSNPKEIKPINGGMKVNLGDLKGDHWAVKKEGNKVEATANLTLTNAKNQTRWNKQVTLTGEIQPDGSALLKPDENAQSDLPVGAQLTCFSANPDANPMDCDHPTIDVYVQENDQTVQGMQYKGQLIPIAPAAPETPSKDVTPTPAPNKTPAPTAKPAPQKPTPPTQMPDQKKSAWQRFLGWLKSTPAPTPKPAPQKPNQPKPPTVLPEPPPAQGPVTPSPQPSPRPDVSPEPPATQTPQTPSQPSVDDNDDDGATEGVDPDAQPGLLATIFQGSEAALGKPAPPTTPAQKGKVLNQAIDFAAQGHLQNGFNLELSHPVTFRGIFIFSTNVHEWGSSEVIRMVSFIGDLFQKYSAGTMLVGDLSAKQGGPLWELDSHGNIVKKNGKSQVAHASHQNGTDADLGYPLDEQLKNFEVLVKNGAVSSHLQTEKFLKILKDIYKTQLLDRIFVDQAIKKAVCEQARKDNEFAADAEILRRLRPNSAHKNHFHVRIKCNIQTQPRCRMESDPPAGPGC